MSQMIGVLFWLLQVVYTFEMSNIIYLFCNFCRTKGDYVDAEGGKEKFTYTISLVFIQCIINSLFAFIGKYVPEEDLTKIHHKPQPPLEVFIPLHC